MMMMEPKKKKKMVSMIVASIGKPSGEMPEGELGESDDMGIKAAAEDIIKAVYKKDPEMLMTALKDFMYMCEECDKGEESESEMKE